MEVAGVKLTSAGLLSLPKQFYPWFDVAHILLTVLALRRETGKNFAHERPLSALLSSLVSCFAGSILVNPLVGKPLWGAFADEYLVLVAVVVFALVFFSPGDVFYKLVKFQPIYLVICAVKEVYRAKKVFGGYTDGVKYLPNSPLLGPVVIAVLKGNGSAFLGPVARAIRGELDFKKSELFKPSATTKECLLAALVFAKFGTPDVMYLSLVGLFLTVKIGGVLGAPVDPFSPLEAVVFGVVDAISPKEEVPAAANKEKKTQ